MEKVVELVDFILKALVSKPSDVRVRYVDGKDVNILEIRASKEDYSKIIGRKGVVISSIRTIVTSFADNDRRKWVLDVPNKTD